MRLIGIDYGRKRVGIAVSDEEGKFALPFAVWENGSDLVEKIRALASEKGASAIVLGESRDLDGRENEILKDIGFLKTALEAVLTIPIYLEPEFYTSAEAKRLQGETKMHDASAAALILKSYLARHQS
jgi:putative Holliday junction resolvase